MSEISWIGLLLSMLLGVATSLVAWLLLQHGLRPRVEISPQMTRRLKRTGEGYVYRIKLVNRRRRRAAVDLHLYVDALLYGRFPGRGSTKRVLRIKTLTQDYGVLSPRGNRVVRLVLGGLPSRDDIDEPDEGVGALHQVLRDPRDYVRVWLVATDSYSGRRSAFQRTYRLDDIVDRFWKPDDSTKLAGPSTQRTEPFVEDESEEPTGDLAIDE